MYKSKKVFKNSKINQSLFLKPQNDDLETKIDISNVYVFESKGIYYLTRLFIRNIIGHCYGGRDVLVYGYESTLINIFTNEIIFQKNSINPIMENELSKDDDIGSYYMHIYPIYKFDSDLLKFEDNLVPISILNELYCNINSKSKVLKK